MKKAKVLTVFIFVIIAALFCSCEQIGNEITDTGKNIDIYTQEDLAKPRKETPADESEPASSAVYITENGSKYHTSDCTRLKKSKIETTPEDAKKHGYAPCSICEPLQ